MLTAVCGAEDAPLWLRPSRAAENTGQDDVRIRRMNYDSADAAAVRKSCVGPRFAGIGGFVDSVAHDVAVADHPGFAGSRPNDTGIRRSHGQSADRGDGLLIKYRRPVVPSVGRFPDSSRGS